jgi:hypothetical protein
MSTVTFKHSAELREIKKDASRRCRARAKAITNGELLSPDLAIRTAHKIALKLENFKMRVGNKLVRLNRNGGEAVALIVTEQTETGNVKTRKSFRNVLDAVKAFNDVVFA